jgi:hypothetical protein
MSTLNNIFVGESWMKHILCNINLPIFNFRINRFFVCVKMLGKKFVFNLSELRRFIFT